MKKIGDARYWRPFLGGGRGTLALRWCFAWLRSCGRRQLANGSGDMLAILLAILNGHASTSSQITVALSLGVDGELRLFGLAANFLADDDFVRVDRSDRSLGEMRRRLGCFRLGIGGRVRIDFRMLA